MNQDLDLSPNSPLDRPTDFSGWKHRVGTPCIARWPGKAVGRKSNEIVHITDWFTTLLTMAGLPVPDDHVIDSKDQSAFLAESRRNRTAKGSSTGTARSCMGSMAELQAGADGAKVLDRPTLPLGFPHIISLVTYPRNVRRSTSLPAQLDDGALRAALEYTVQNASATATYQAWLPCAPPASPLPIVGSITRIGAIASSPRFSSAGVWLASQATPSIRRSQICTMLASSSTRAKKPRSPALPGSVRAD